MRRLSLVLSLHVALLWLCDAGDAAMKPTLIIRLEQNDSSLAPSIVAFGPNGQFYTAYRTHGPQHQSSAVWVRAFDSDTGRELRQAQVKVSRVQLPQTASMFQVSPDGKLLLYVETPAIIGPNQATYVAVLDAATPNNQQLGFCPDCLYRTRAFLVLATTATPSFLAHRWSGQVQRIIH